MKVIAIDSSGLVASIAIAEDGVLLAAYSTQYRKTHSQTLLPMLAEVCDRIDLDQTTVDAIAIAQGPGSFTGLRIGAATAKGLAFSWGIPILPISTLEGLAYHFWGTDKLVCPLMDARRGEVYTAVYRFVRDGEGMRMTEVFAPCAVHISAVLECLGNLGEEVIFLGDGVAVYEEIIRSTKELTFLLAPAHKRVQSAANIAILATTNHTRSVPLHTAAIQTDTTALHTVSAAAFQPDYFRLSQAEREQSEKQLIIRRLQMQDVDAISRMEAQSFSMPWSAADFADLANAEDALYLVAVIGEQPVGCCGATLVADEAYINNIVVDTAYRRRKIATRLLEALIREGQKQGIPNFTLEVRIGNVGAIQLYEKVGFTSEGIRPNFYEKPREDAYIMWLRT
ncbi:MAG: tRNA (adenosine(37)-N6)-threonylcarbamoyltransferase complex dimerization subunit type 1 TsaB [Clostridium sp.]|jgi:tRNA threonylcarbamoyl adenosine modification protein YeaZ/ribosomal-protein-alanine acetyltransferase|nr:tRNA (adenosine(37)-N6)-threonylcarbamoyltransferase complex dimerization subunit type 1 TsaB [Clostridium sp.]